MSTYVKNLLNEPTTETEVNIKKKTILIQHLFKGIFLLVTALFLPPLAYVYFIDNTNYGFGAYLFTLLLTVISMLCLLGVSIWYLEYSENKIKTEYRFTNADNHLLLARICGIQI